nr:MAG TPA: hypothetical protein [Caudoviricetes sp.]DAN78918.1 MAG TPA: hypothetical protein [Caudoviricetes sp.]DAV08708.1 MAG TPA: hypothetical protein [Caudoviricetes sp.]DAV31632.1 MAG TPA: hypothetical protein [Caudoviricetes sp.]
MSYLNLNYSDRTLRLSISCGCPPPNQGRAPSSPVVRTLQR